MGCKYRASQITCLPLLHISKDANLAHLMLIDASGFAHRAYHVGGAQFRSDGLPTWAVTGFLAMMWRLLGAAQADAPTHCACVFDAPGKTFRHTLFPAYKNNRPARDQELAAQLPYMRIAAEAMGLTPVECSGYEADDVIATLATDALARGIRCTIVSSDKDFAQLVRDDCVEIIDPVARVRIRETDVRGVKFGVEPHQVPEFQALAGDAVDNIPGIDGIGPREAARLVNLFGPVENVVSGVRAKAWHFTPLQRQRLRGALDDLVLYRKLATLDRNVPLGLSWDELAVKPILRGHVDKILTVLEAKGRFDAIFAGVPVLARVVEPLGDRDALEWWREELAAAGQSLPDEPQCGLYMGRLGKGCPLVPARIWREVERDPLNQEPTGREFLRCEIGGRPADAVLEWSRLARMPVDEAKFAFESADAAWCRKHAPDLPKAAPDRPIDIRKMPAPRCPPSPPKRRKRA